MPPGAGIAVIVVLLAAPAAGTARGEWDFNGARIELMLGVGPRGRPALAHLHLVEMAIVSPHRRMELTLPFLVLEAHARRPTGKGSLGYSALYAPVLFIGSGALFQRANSAPLTAFLATLLRLEGGSISWTPGGQGNIHRAGAYAASLSLVARNRLGLFPGGPLHLRETLALGLSLRVDDRADSGSQWPRFVCGAGLFGSLAKETAGPSSREAGAWLSCGLGFMPLD